MSVLDPRVVGIIKALRAVPEISEVMAELRPSTRRYWIGPQPPVDAVSVDPRTIRGAWRIARARAWVDDFGLPMRKPKRTRYLQTWHGIALKRVGSDAPDADLCARSVTPTIARWDGLMSPSVFFAETTARAIGYRGTLVSGSPFGDAVLARSAEAGLRARLDLPDDRLIVLYSPTQRTGAAKRGSDPEIDLAGWWRELGEQAYLLLRSHPSDRLSVPSRFRNAVRDITDEPDLASWIAAADVLLTDYASVVFDFARLQRPIAYFAPGFDAYVRRTNGLYLDPVRSGPGPVLRTQVELHDWVRERAVGEPKATYPDFAETFAGTCDGQSARRAIEWLLP